MSTPKYPSYKDVPIPWISSIPEHWDWKPVLGAACKRDEDNKGMKEDNLLSLSYGNIVNKDINTSDGLLPDSFETYQIVKPGDIVLRLTDLQNDKRSLRTALVTQTGIITSAYLALKPRGIDPKYLGYLLRAYDLSKVFYSMGGGLRQSMKYGDIKRMPLVIPTKAEQSEIATFLDHETAKIDALIAEQQRLIELLQEKRQAVISHAVTKGLNSDAPMKDSGVEWLGEVPEHWEVTSIKRIVATPVTDGPHETPAFLDEGVPFVSAEAVSSGRIDWERIRGFISIEDHRRYAQKYLPQQGDIFMIKSGATTGVSTIVETEAEFNIWSPLAVIRCGPEALPRFILHFIRSRNFLEGVTLGWSFGTQQNIGMGVIENLAIVIPPLDVQLQIVDLLDRYTKQASDLIGEAEKAISILKERRSALISAAVTGQIDVRGLVPEAAAA